MPIGGWVGSAPESKSESDQDKIPKVTPGQNVEKLSLSPAEGFLFSRIDGTASIERLTRESGMDEARALELLESLRNKGAVSWGDGTPSADADPYEGMEFDPFELSEDVDLDEDTRKKILFLYARMNEMTHYNVLRIDRRADSKQIKKAYFGVSKEFHPDTFFRKNIGSYKAKIEAIFKRISTSYDVLSNEQKRKAYDATLPYEPTPEEIEEQKRKRDRKKRDERLKEERRRRLLKRMPIGRRKAKARQHLEEARKHKQDGDLLQAANSVKVGLALDPENEELKQLHDEVNPKASEMRSNKEFKRGQAEESMGRQEEALEAYLRAIEANPGDARPMLHAATMLLELNRDLRQGLTFCRMANQLEPNNAKVILVLGKIYLALGMTKNAVRELSRYVSENPLDEHTAALLKDLKKKSR